MNNSAIELFNESKETLEKAKSYLNQNEFEEVITIIYEVTEKAINSLIIHKTKKIPKISLNLVELAEIANIPDEYNKLFKKMIGKDFTTSYATYMYDQTESHKNEIREMIYDVDELLDYIENELNE